MRSFLNFLEEGSAWLEKISKPMEKKMAYFFCITEIVVCLISIAIAVGFFVYCFQKEISLDMRIILLLFVTVILFMMGSYIHMIVTRDLAHIRGQKTEKGEEKNNPLEFK